jgi:hypothetical protein
MMTRNLRAAENAGANEEVNEGVTIPFPMTLSSLLFLDGWKWDTREVAGVMYVGGPPAVMKTFETPGFLVKGLSHIANSLDGKNVAHTISVGTSNSVFSYTFSPASIYFTNFTRSDASMFELSLTAFSDFMISGDFPGFYETQINFSPPMPYEANTATLTVTPPSVSVYPPSVTPPPIVYELGIASISITDPETFVKQLDASKAVEEGVKRALLPFATKLV